jgi:hypothetical protein
MMLNSTMATAISAAATTLLKSTIAATPAQINTYPPGYGEPSSAVHNRIHEFFVKPMNYVLLTPVILVGLAAIVINILHMRIRADPEVDAALRRSEEARLGMIEQIKIERAQGKKERAAARMTAKQANTVQKK